LIHIAYCCVYHRNQQTWPIIRVAYFEAYGRTPEIDEPGQLLRTAHGEYGLNFDTLAPESFIPYLYFFVIRSALRVSVCVPHGAFLSKRVVLFLSFACAFAWVE
jgi:hypothetical protein